MPPRLHVDLPLNGGSTLSLPGGAARHVQVLRLQPGAALTLFDGTGGEWSARVLHMGRTDVQVHVEEHVVVDRELSCSVTLALGMPANERMDTVVEKATELGAMAIQPLICQRSVLRLAGERAQKKVAHWQAVAVAACEQSGRTRVPLVEPVRTFDDWLARLDENAGSGASAGARRVVLSFRGAAPDPHTRPGPLLCLSGPEGGLTEAEESAALRSGFIPIYLGPRVLRADTAPLALLAHVALSVPAPEEETR